jgi:hypothetical protein
VDGGVTLNVSFGMYYPKRYYRGCVVVEVSAEHESPRTCVGGGVEMLAGFVIGRAWVGHRPGGRWAGEGGLLDDRGPPYALTAYSDRIALLISASVSKPR